MTQLGERFIVRIIWLDYLEICGKGVLRGLYVGRKSDPALRGEIFLLEIVCWISFFHSLRWGIIIYFHASMRITVLLAY